jgi:hypothetical protein
MRNSPRSAAIEINTMQARITNVPSTKLTNAIEVPRPASGYEWQ